MSFLQFLIHEICPSIMKIISVKINYCLLAWSNFFMMCYIHAFLQIISIVLLNKINTSEGLEDYFDPNFDKNKNCKHEDLMSKLMEDSLKRK